MQLDFACEEVLPRLVALGIVHEEASGGFLAVAPTEAIVQLQGVWQEASTTTDSVWGLRGSVAGGMTSSMLGSSDTAINLQRRVRGGVAQAVGDRRATVPPASSHVYSGDRACLVGPQQGVSSTHSRVRDGVQQCGLHRVRAVVHRPWPRLTRAGASAVGLGVVSKPRGPLAGVTRVPW